MSYVAGRVAIVPKGAFSESTQYDRLDMVAYNGSAYVSKTRPPVGTLPTNTQYWALSIDMASKADAEDFDELKDRVDVIEPSMEKITPLPTPTKPYTSSKFNQLSTCPTDTNNQNPNLSCSGNWGIYVANGNEITHTNAYATEWVSEQLPLAEDDAIAYVGEVDANVGVVAITYFGEMYVYGYSYVWTKVQPHFENGKISSVCICYENNKFYINEITESNGQYVVHTLISDSITDLSSAEVADFELTFANEVYMSQISCANGHFLYTAKEDASYSQEIYWLDINFTVQYSTTISKEVRWIMSIPNDFSGRFACGFYDGLARISIENNELSVSYVPETFLNPSRLVVNASTAMAYFASSGKLYTINKLLVGNVQLVSESSVWRKVAFSIAYASNIVTISSLGNTYSMQNGCDYNLRAYDDGTYEWVKVVN